MEPKWNVKIANIDKKNSKFSVLMEPKWNVKDYISAVGDSYKRY